MKTKAIHLTLALFTIAGASAKPPGRSEERRPPPPPPFAFFDADHDGMLSAREIRSASASLAQLDRDGDGKITSDEMRPQRPANGHPVPQGEFPQGPPPRDMRPVPPLIAALDADRDGTISADELNGATEALKSLDTNGNGTLDPEELRPPHGPPPPEGEQDEQRPFGLPPE